VYVGKSKLWAALGCVGAVVGPLDLLCSAKARNQSEQRCAL